MFGRYLIRRLAVMPQSLSIARQAVPAATVRPWACSLPAPRIARYATENAAPLVGDPNVEVAYERERPEYYTKVSLQMRSWDHAILDSFVTFLQRSSSAFEIDCSGRVVLPTHMRRWTLLKSPHVFKKHRVQYEMRTHKRVIEITNMKRATADTYLEYIQECLPEGVSMKITKHSAEPMLDQPPKSGGEN